MKDRKYEENPLKLNLQFFAEDGEPVNPTDPVDPPAEPKTYTQVEVDEMMKGLITQEEMNKTFNKRFAEIQAKADEEKAEEKRLAQLSADERAKEEAALKDDKIKRLENELKLKELEADTVARLQEEGINVAFKDFLMREDGEKTNEAIKIFKQVYDEAIEKEVEKRYLVGETPTGSVSSPSGQVNPFRDETLNLTEQGRLLRENPDLYKRLKSEAGK